MNRTAGARITPMLCLLAVAACKGDPPRQIQDEALRAGFTASSFRAADEDYFAPMDSGIVLSSEEIRGRNTWHVWTAGNDRFWTEISKRSHGTLDLLKTISSHPSLKNSRDNRWSYLGLVNEPCFEKPRGPDPARFGLWLDSRRADCPPDPFENEQKYPGVPLGARGKTVPVGSSYGYATGVLGLRLFPNPDFDEAAQEAWNAERYYSDPSYYHDSDLVAPFRVGMSCSFCHVGPNPVNPPRDPENPEWENLSSNVGSQYFWVDRVFAWEADESSFPFQLFHSSRPGALDPSLVSSDSINNPRTMNAVYELQARLAIAKTFGREELGGGSKNNRQFEAGPFADFFKRPSTVYTPRVLKDGADSVGALGALNRVFVNIGMFSEEWLQHFNPLVGGRRTTPMEIAIARDNSAYWQATEAQTSDMALFLIKSSAAHRLEDVRDAELARRLVSDPVQVDRGKNVFADRCARCHSSKLPADLPMLSPDDCIGPNYLECWQKYWAFTKTDDFREQMRTIVRSPDFLENNFLSTDFRVPVTLLETNACSPLASNALEGRIWDNFSSQSYKELPSVGTITVHHPITGEPRKFEMPGGGRGYTRPASLVSLWSTAPFLLNNTVGTFHSSPSVEARLASFHDSIEQLLWPEKRDKDHVLGDRVPGVIDRTTAQSYVRVPSGYLPDLLQTLKGPLTRWVPYVFDSEGIEIGPIPSGTPLNLIANLGLVSEDTDAIARLAHQKKVVALLLKAKSDLKDLPKGATDQQARAVFADLVEPMLELSTCPDFVVNRGHYFGTAKFAEEPGLSDSEKHDLIAFLKTF